MSVSERAGHSRLRRVLQSEYARPVILMVAVFVLWEVVIDVFQIKPYLIPSPLSVAKMLVTEWPRPARLRLRSIVSRTAASRSTRSWAAITFEFKGLERLGGGGTCRP